MKWKPFFIVFEGLSFREKNNNSAHKLQQLRIVVSAQTCYVRPPKVGKN